jgi:hypothetical protein
MDGDEQERRWLQNPDKEQPKSETEGIVVLNRRLQKNTDLGQSAPNLPDDPFI